MAGACSTSSRAVSVPALPKVCGAPRGTSRKSPGPPVRSRPSKVKAIGPSSTKNASEQLTCRCAGGFRPPGGSVRSISEKSPPVCAATALNAITLPRAVSRCPSPGGTTPGPATGSGRHVEVGQHLGGADPDHQLARHPVVLPELLRPVGPHIPGRDRRGRAQQLAGIVGQLGPALDLDEPVGLPLQVG